MARPAARHPTELELAILQILWRAGSGSGRDVQAELNRAGRTLAYTSVITILISVAMFTKQHRHSQPSTSSRSNHTIISHYRYWSINYSNHQPVSRYHTLRLPVVFGGWFTGV